MTRVELSAALRRSWLELPPEWLFVVSFLLLIGAGTAGLLWLPGLYTGAPLSALDALFTATSAACVTGLAVVDTATYFTWFGQAWLLLLIQLGGLGLIGITSVIIGAMGRRLSLRTEMIVVPTLQPRHGSHLSRLTIGMIQFTLAAEAVVALVLWLLWLPRFGAGPAAWHAVFHAVSAFCNAGFSTFSDSAIGQARSPAVLLTLTAAITLGGLGYLSTLELAGWVRVRRSARRRRLSVHTFAALTTSAVLLVAGALAYGALERRATLVELATDDAAVNALFMSATARTAGFNSVPYAEISNGSAMVTIFLMGVGGSPGSTAGGVKTTALAILVALAWSRIRGRRFVQLGHRSIPEGTVQRTISLLMLFFLTVMILTVVLSFTETRGGDVAASRSAFLPLLFESVSALATVGLSMDVTPTLTSEGRAAVALAMFIGRVGPLAFFALISLRTRSSAVTRTAAEDLIAG